MIFIKRGITLSNDAFKNLVSIMKNSIKPKRENSEISDFYDVLKDLEEGKNPANKDDLKPLIEKQ